jgi:signal transduction histidine kinase
VFDEVFQFILRMAARKRLLWGEKLGIDSTTIQANASMKSIFRKASGKGWKDYTEKLAKKAGIEDPTEAELRQFDKKRPGKKVSNDDWESPSDPDARITRMKNGTTRLVYKAEHAVDLESDLIVSATVHPGNAADTGTVIDTAIDAAANLKEAGCENEVGAIVADKGYPSTKVVTRAAEFGMQAYIPERASPAQRRWTGKDPAEKKAVYAARRRTKSEHQKLLSRTRSELVERSFAHVCDTGGARRTWLRGLQSVTKRHLMVASQSRMLAHEMRRRRDAALEFSASTRERNRLAANLHDTLLQTLRGIDFQLGACRAYRHSGVADSDDHLEVARRMVNHASEELRDSVWALRTMPLAGRSFGESLEAVARQAGHGHAEHISVRVEGARFELPQFVAGNLLLVTQEAIHNALRHGRSAAGSVSAADRGRYARRSTGRTPPGPRS